MWSSVLLTIILPSSLAFGIGSGLLEQPGMPIWGGGGVESGGGVGRDTPAVEDKHLQRRRARTF